MRRIIGGLLMATLLLAGCSTLRFAYNQAPDLAYWWIDGYADLDNDQSKQLRESLTHWFRWHRSSELPLYAGMLARGESQVQEPATPTQACRWYDEIMARIDAASEHAVPAMAALARTITAEQVAHIERRYDKKNREFADDYLQDTPAERLKAAVKVAQERAEILYGDLDAAQRQLLTRSIAQSPFDPERWLAERKRRQQDVLRLLRRLLSEPTTLAQTQDEIRAVIARMRVSPDEAYRDYQRRLLQHNCTLAAQLHNVSSTAQRRAAAKKLRGWQEDLRALAPSS